MYGAFYHEGTVNILYELMNLGSLRNVINILKNNRNPKQQTLIDEMVVSYMIKEVLFS